MKEGRVVADGPKARILNGKLISEVYGTGIGILEQEGHFRAFPAGGDA